MTSLHQYISVIGCFQGCVLFGLLITDSRVTTASKLLGVHCLVIGLYLLLPFVTTLEGSSLSWLASFGFFIPLCFGPLLFLYCRCAVSSDRLRVLDLIHLAPLLFGYAFNADTLWFDSDGFRAWIVGARPPNLRVWLSEYLLFAVALFYLAKTIKLINDFQEQASRTVSSFNPNVFTWLWTLVLGLSFVWLAKAIMAFGSFASPFMFAFSDAVIVLFIYLIALAHWRNPTLFAVKELVSSESALHKAKLKGVPEERGLLDDETRANLYELVTKCVEEQALYRNSELTLASLADTCGLATHHLSEILNQHSGRNFNQFINTYRVEFVCKRLRESASENFLDLAVEAGFSSKSTFNTMFKKLKGLTPTQYRKQLDRV